MTEKVTVTKSSGETIKRPADRKPKAVDAEASGAENITVFEFKGETYTADGDNITGETMEDLEKGFLHKGVRALIGDEQWETAKKYPVRELKDMWEAWGKAAGQGNS